jgi:hypothetical protein
LALVACGGSPQATRNPEGQPQPIAAPSIPVIARTTPTPAQPNNPPAKPDEVNEVVARVFSKAAKIDSDYAPSFLVGDFNGDGSEDIAIVVKPSPDSLAEINNEFSNWTLEDVREPKQASKPQLPKAEKTDTLLAIIHGVGANGWRNREARQAFLIRNAVGTNPRVESVTSRALDPSPTSRLPAKSDVIQETINGHVGLIYWAGARYALYPVIK